MSQLHEPVLVEEVLGLLKPKSSDNYLDLTAGYGGHAKAIMSKMNSYSETVLIDRDKVANDYLKTQFFDKKVSIIQDDFYHASLKLKEQARTFNIILADLGVSSQHFNDLARGFSFKDNASLDMRMDQSQALSADYVVNKYSKEELIRLLTEYGEEPKARLITKLIIDNRPLKDTNELARICLQAWPGRSKVHPATRTFQAIRIEVNQEIDQLRNSLPIWFDLLKPAGRLAIISFHSIEDRLVKQFFKEISGNQYDSRATLLTKKPVTADQMEIDNNPRSRSAKLRAVVKK